MSYRIHIFGASGSGTTTLGALLSERTHLPHFDTDDYFWVKTTVPYTVKREVPERLASLAQDLAREDSWILSGSLCGWGDSLVPQFTLAVFLWIPHELRMRRLKEREVCRYGLEALSPGGWFHSNHLEFMAWAEQYDSAGPDVRSRVLHEQWMSTLPCPLLKLEGAYSTEELAGMVERELGLHETRRGGSSPPP